MSEGMELIAIVALRNEKGSYNSSFYRLKKLMIVALRNEKGSYNWHNIGNRNQ